MNEEIPTQPSTMETIGQTEQRSKKNPIMLASAIILLVLIVGAAVAIAVTKMSKADTGADSPSQAVDNFLKGVSTVDFKMMSENLEPSMAKSLQPLYDEMKSAMDDAKLSTKDFGFGNDFGKFNNLKFKEVSYGDDVSRVDFLSGTYKMVPTEKLNTSDDKFLKLFPKLEVFQDGSSDDMKTDLTPIEGDFSKSKQKLEDAGLGKADHYFFMTVKRDGKWYVSLTYDTFEWMRIADSSSTSDIHLFKVLAPKVPKFDSGNREGNGASSPEKAMNTNFDPGINLINDFLTGDFTTKGFLKAKNAMISQFSPDEMAAAYDYFSDDMIDLSTIDQIESQSKNISTLSDYAGIDPAKLKLSFTSFVKGAKTSNIKSIEDSKIVKVDSSNQVFKIAMKEGFLSSKIVKQIVSQVGTMGSSGNDELDKFIREFKYSGESILGSLREVNINLSSSVECMLVANVDLAFDNSVKEDVQSFAKYTDSKVSSRDGYVIVTPQGTDQKYCIEEYIDETAPEMNTDQRDIVIKAYKAGIESGSVATQIDGKWYINMTGSWANMLAAIIATIR